MILCGLVSTYLCMQASMYIYIYDVLYVYPHINGNVFICLWHLKEKKTYIHGGQRWSTVVNGRSEKTSGIGSLGSLWLMRGIGQ